jgi:hypothetical protein
VALGCRGGEQIYPSWETITGQLIRLHRFAGLARRDDRDYHGSENAGDLPLASTALTLFPGERK